MARSLAACALLVGAAAGALAASASAADAAASSARSLRVLERPATRDGATAAVGVGPARAATLASGAPMTVHVGSALVEWNAPEGFSVGAEVLRDGSVVAEGRGHSHLGGWLSVGLAASASAPSPEEEAPFAIQAGDLVRLAVISGSLRAEAVVPPLTAHIETAAGRVSGESEPGRTIHVEYAPEDERIVRTIHASLYRDAFETLVPPEPRPADRWRVQAQPDGRWALDLGALEPGPGDFAWVSTLDDDGHRFVHDLAVPAHYLRDDGLLLSVGRPGSQTSFAVEGVADGPLADVALHHRAMAFHWGLRRRYFSVAYGFLELPRPLEAGDRVSTTTRAALPSDESAGRMEVMLPPLEIAFQPDGTLEGTAAPEAELWLGMRGPDTQSLTETLRADAQGRWRSAAPVHVGAGWQVTAAAPVGNIGLRFLRTRTAPLVRVMADTPFLVVHADLRALPPFQPASERITVTLRGPDGQIRGRGIGAAFNGDGELRPVPIAIEPPDAAVFDNQPPFVAIRPGDQLEIEQIAGDPHVVRVPRLEAQIDEARNALSLRAPPLARVSLAMLGAWNGALWGHRPVHALRTDSDAAGQASLDLASLTPTDPGFNQPHWGIASLALPGGVEVATGFARASVTVDLDSGALRGFGPPWQGAEVELFDVDGRLRGSDGQAGRIVNRTGLFHERFWDRDSTTWSAQLVDAVGQRLRPAWGDELVVRFGAEPWQVTVPLLEAVVFAEQDRIGGHGPVAGEVVVEGRTAGAPWQRRVQTDAQGRFDLDLGGQAVDLRFGDPVVLRTTAGRISLTGSAVSPGLTLDLDRGSLAANVGAMRVVTAGLRHDGRLLASHVHRSRPDGSFRALFDARQLAPGREVALATHSHGGLPVAAALRVPALSVAPDPVRGEVRIHAPVGMSLSVSITPRPGEYDAGPHGVPASGIVRLRGVEDAALDLRPGSVVQVTLRTPQGHAVLRQAAIPEISVPVGGARVCGWARPGALIGLRAYRGGRELAHGDAVADALGRYTFLLRDELGAQRFLAAGDRVVVASDDGTREQILPRLEGRIDLAASTVFEGRAEPGSRGVLSHLERPDCRRWSGRPEGRPWTADADGAIVGDGQGPLAVRGIDIAFEAYTIQGLGMPAIFDLARAHRDGVRPYRLLRELRAAVYVDTPRVDGEADAGAVISLTLRGAGGQVRGRALTVADGDGLWRARWRDEAGQDLWPRPGDRIHVRSGPSSAELELRPFGFDRDGERLMGTAPPGSSVWLRYTLDPALFGGEALGDEPQVTTVLVETDADGRFEIPLASEGQGWTEPDLVSIRASLPLEGRHELVAQWRRPPDLGETPAYAYLPWAAARRHVYEARSASQLVNVFKQHRRQLLDTALISLSITGTVASNFAYVEGSASPVPDAVSVDGHTLRWTIERPRTSGVTVTRQATPLEVGHHAAGQASVRARMNR